MEDTTIIKTQYAYMLRLDVPNDAEKFEDLIHKWIEKYSCTFYLGKKENGAQTGKLHYQLIVWFEQKLCNKNMTKLRNWWSDKCGSHKNSHAFTSARKVASLASYSTKEDTELFTNLSTGQLLKIPKWKNKDALKKEKSVKFIELLEKSLENFKEKPVPGDEYSQMVSPFEPFKKGTPDFREFCEILNDCHVAIFNKPCSYPKKYYELALTYKIIEFTRYAELCGIYRTY